MMHYCSHTLKEPFVRTISDKKDVRGSLGLEVGPTAGNNSANPGHLHGLQQNRQHILRVFDDDASKAHVNWGVSGMNKVEELLRRFVGWRFPEEESTNIFSLLVSSVWNRHDKHKPIWGSQSGGLGTNAGDQQ